MTTMQLIISIIKQLMIAVRNYAGAILLVLGSIHFAGCVLFIIFFSAIGINPLSQYWEMFDSPPAYSLVAMVMTMFTWFVLLTTEDTRPMKYPE